MRTYAAADVCCSIRMPDVCLTYADVC
jgi:hypothetical protein